MADINVEVAIYCTCGEELDTEVTEASQYNRWRTSVDVTPCEKCLDAAEEKGFAKGEESVDA